MTSEPEIAMCTYLIDIETLASMFASAKEGDEECQMFVRACEDWMKEAQEENQSRCVACDKLFDDWMQQVGQFQISVQDAKDVPTLVSGACVECAARGKIFIMDKITTKLGKPGAHFVQEQPPLH
jgi:hypothetical protein